MTLDELVEQRAVLVEQEQDHLLHAAEARGALKLIDFWLGRLRADSSQPPAKEPDGADSHPE